MANARNMDRVPQALLAASALTVALLLFLHIAAVQEQAKNRHLAYVQGDQLTYLEFAIQSYESNLHYTGERGQMPLYPWILSLFYSPELSDLDYFERSKRVNLALSLAVLAALGIAFFARFSRLYATWSILCLAMLVYAIKSPYVLVENLYYGLFAFTFILSLDTLSAPDWRKSIACGALFALAHFTKASALPALLLFSSSYGVGLLVAGVRRELTLRQARESMLRALLPIVVFLALLSPYLLESQAKYGSLFYNVNTTFYMWYRNWGDAEAGTIAHGDKDGWPDLPPEEIPSLQKYLDDHGVGSMFWRLFNGSKRILSQACFDSGQIRTFNYGHCSQTMLGLVAIVGSLALLCRSTPGRLQSKDIAKIWFVATILLVYALAAAWYIPITGHRGARMILLIFAPFLWTVGLLVHHPRVFSLRVKLFGRRRRLFSLLLGIMYLSLIFEIYLTATARAATVYGGA